MSTESSATSTGPVIRKRPAAERGQAEHGWLHARFTFSFAGYHDPEHMRFRSLRVMNNDVIEPGGGFPTHPHHDAEIFTYVMSGALEHRDSMGNGSVITAGNLQYMSAGAGVQHSEFNPSSDEPTELYQVWILPNVRGGEPRYAEKKLSEIARDNALTLILAGEEKGEATVMRQNAEVFFGRLDAGKTLEVPASDDRPHVWVQVISGNVDALGEALGKADGLAVQNHPQAFELKATADATLLVFRLG